jgi:hypothetical protein
LPPLLVAAYDQVFRLQLSVLDGKTSIVPTLSFTSVSTWAAKPSR